MKLGQLRASIRAAKGVLPTIEVALYPGAPVIPFALQKQALMDELEKAFPGGKAVETGLTFSEKTGLLSSEFGASMAAHVVDVITSAATAAHAAPVAEPPFDAVQDAIHGPSDDLDLTDDLLLDTLAPASAADDDLLV